MRVCRIVVWLFAALWALALGVLAIGTFGWFGQVRDPLSGVYLVLLGQPWIVFLPASPVSAVLAPGANLLLLLLLCRHRGSRSGR